LDTLEELKFSIKRDDSSKGEIRAQTEEYWSGIFHCYGNLIGVFLAPAGTNQTKVEIQSLYVQAGADLACTDRAQQVISAISQRLRQDLAAPSVLSQPMPAAASVSLPRPEFLQNRFKELADQLSAGIKEHHVSRLAILPLADAGQKTNTPLGNYLTEKLTNELYKTASAKVIERSQLQRVIDELDLTLRGTFDDASVKRIGRLLGADAVIIGTYAELASDTVEVNTRIVTVETAEVVGVGSIQIPRTLVEKLVR
jgi:TolB-like protein